MPSRWPRTGCTALESVHKLAEVDELVADDLIVGVKSHLSAVALGHFEVAAALCLGAVHCADLAAEILAEVFE